ncbi:putative cysteine proteinase CG12163 isoform X2 [Pollicipes pollicipes]|nr:putative cysteine proteinase CG12163 isoform X2 [Pollicipes pollicipes]XP_037072415.1 putative cysteine proteinase CG12163 isoform X2 [Pollicipes pollicipes]XP_037072416.1 putative cysteine proteinase CG12163 isoform X2 [Pollicipes pollicipes]XP_037072417.1 putative cysteine proteinase CG12163 isoform X2 [Pollicipes pollicipes]
MLKLFAAAVLTLQVCAAAGLGAYKQHHSVDETVMEMAKFAVPRIQKHIKSDHFFTLRSVNKIHKQLVSGTNYRLEVLLVETDCAAEAGADGLECAAASRPDTVTCRLVVYDVPWTGHRELTKHQCSTPAPARKAQGRRKHGKLRRRLWGKRLAGKELLAKFAAFVRQYNRTYPSSAEYRRRMQVFADNMEHARNFQRMERGTARYGITKFSDMTVEEFRATRLGLGLSRPRPAPAGAFRQPAVIPDIADMPASFDWRDKGAVTAVKDQGQCGSCWAFSVTGNVEGQYFIKHKKLLSFSEQELVDCDTDDHGCQGGWPDQAYKFIEFLGGLEQEKDYPYEARNGQCRLNKTDLVVKLTGSLDLPKNEADIQKWLFANGPVSIGVNANPLMFYQGGIIDVWSFLCRASAIDHGVLLVGFGEHDYPVVNKKKPFWIVKNSWGGNWGEQGYFRLFRGSDECGVQDMASSSVVA